MSRVILHMKNFKYATFRKHLSPLYTQVNAKSAERQASQQMKLGASNDSSSAHPVCTVIGTLQYSYSFFDSFALCAASPWGSNSIFTETSGPSDLINFIFFFGGFFKVPSLSFTLYSSVLWGIP